MSLKTTCLKFHSNLPVTNDLSVRVTWFGVTPLQSYLNNYQISCDILPHIYYNVVLLSLISRNVECYSTSYFHFSNVIMGAIASQITSLMIVYTTVYSDADEKKSKLRVTGLCAGNSPWTGEFPAHIASNAENISIWWRHHVSKYRYFSSGKC